LSLGIFLKKKKTAWFSLALSLDFCKYTIAYEYLETLNGETFFATKEKTSLSFGNISLGRRMFPPKFSEYS